MIVILLSNGLLKYTKVVICATAV